MNQLVFHIGHHKTGSTWLQQNYFNELEEFNLLNDYIKPWDDSLCQAVILDKDATSAKKIINQRSESKKINVLSAERLSGHPISGGYDMSAIANCLFELSPTAKIIVVTRNPSDFIMSTYKQMIREGYRGTLKEYLNLNKWKTAGPTLDYFIQEKICKTYRNLFGNENVLILDFETFSKDKSTFIKTINSFLGIDVQLKNEILGQKVAQAYPDNRTRALRFLNRYRKTEFNQFPTISLGNNSIKKLSYALSFLFSKAKLIEVEFIKNYLSAKLK